MGRAGCVANRSVPLRLDTTNVLKEKTTNIENKSGGTGGNSINMNIKTQTVNTHFAN